MEYDQILKVAFFFILGAAFFIILPIAILNIRQSYINKVDNVLKRMEDANSLIPDDLIILREDLQNANDQVRLSLEKLYLLRGEYVAPRSIDVLNDMQSIFVNDLEELDNAIAIVDELINPTKNSYADIPFSFLITLGQIHPMLPPLIFLIFLIFLLILPIRFIYKYFTFK